LIEIQADKGSHQQLFFNVNRTVFLFLLLFAEYLEEDHGECLPGKGKKIFF